MQAVTTEPGLEHDHPGSSPRSESLAEDQQVSTSEPDPETDHPIPPAPRLEILFDIGPDPLSEDQQLPGHMQALQKELADPHSALRLRLKDKLERAIASHATTATVREPVPLEAATGLGHRGLGDPMDGSRGSVAQPASSAPAGGQAGAGAAPGQEAVFATTTSLQGGPMDATRQKAGGREPSVQSVMGVLRAPRDAGGAFMMRGPRPEEAAFVGNRAGAFGFGLVSSDLPYGMQTITLHKDQSPALYQPFRDDHERRKEAQARQLPSGNTMATFLPTLSPPVKR